MAARQLRLQLLPLSRCATEPVRCCVEGPGQLLYLSGIKTLVLGVASVFLESSAIHFNVVIISWLVLCRQFITAFWGTSTYFGKQVPPTSFVILEMAFLKEQYWDTALQPLSS